MHRKVLKQQRTRMRSETARTPFEQLHCTPWANHVQKTCVFYAHKPLHLSKNCWRKWKPFSFEKRTKIFACILTAGHHGKMMEMDGKSEWWSGVVWDLCVFRKTESFVYGPARIIFSNVCDRPKSRIRSIDDLIWSEPAERLFSSQIK